MIYLLVGLGLWFSAHMLARLAPGLRRDIDSAIGQKASKGIISIVLLAALFLIVTGYRGADYVAVYTPLPGVGHLNNLLMLIALFTFGIGRAGGRLSARIRHPMLWGVFIWGVAHLLVNGDLASIVMFGALGLWGPVQMYLINQHEGPWERPMPGNALQDWKLALIVLFAFFVIAGIHWLLGHSPFLGTYT